MQYRAIRAVFRNTRWGLIVSLLSVLLSSGCAPYRMRNSFEDYDEAYAEAENHQMLLNLARLAQHDPTYFFQLGSISALYQFSGSMTAGGGESAWPNSATGSIVQPIKNWLFGPASAMAGTFSEPTFQFGIFEVFRG